MNETYRAGLGLCIIAAASTVGSASELDFRDPKNVAIVISRDGAKSLREQGIGDAAEHFRDKTVLVHGKVTVKDDVPRIVVEEASQIRVVEPE